MLIICLAAFESDGESELFTELYQRYHRDVYRMAYSILRNRALAEDTAQDTWVWTARHFSRLQEVTPRKRKAYLITAARNKALNVKAREKRHISWEAAGISSAGGQYFISSRKLQPYPGDEICAGNEQQRNRAGIAHESCHCGYPHSERTKTPDRKNRGGNGI